MDQISAGGSCRISSKDYQGMPGVPQPAICPYCGGKRYHIGVKFGTRMWWCPEPDECTCPGVMAEKAAQKAEQEAREQAEQQRRREKKKAQLLQSSGISKRFLRRTFATFQPTPETEKAFRICRRYTETFRELKGDKNSLMLAGNCGTGKTHLAAAIANELLEQMVPVLFTTPNDLTAAVRSTFQRNGSQTDKVQMYQKIPLLVLDDLGKEPPTEWSVSLLYRVINARYEADAPMVITTNYDAPSLVKRLTPPGGDGITGKSIVDRLIEMCYYLPITGKSHRKGGTP